MLINRVTLFTFGTRFAVDEDHAGGLGGLSAVVLDGVPMFCGGSDRESYFSACYKFDNATNEWKEVRR
jgi:hypothetical protein